MNMMNVAGIVAKINDHQNRYNKKYQKWVSLHAPVPSSSQIIRGHAPVPSSSQTIGGHAPVPSSSQIIRGHAPVPSSSQIIRGHAPVPSSSQVIGGHAPVPSSSQIIGGQKQHKMNNVTVHILRISDDKATRHRRFRQTQMFA